MPARPHAVPASIIICTHNRCDVLRETLPALFAELRSAAAPMEVLVVDNASTDDTARVVDALCASSGLAARRVLEPRLGLNHARNAGYRAAASDILWYLDDDAVVRHGWGTAIAAAFADPGVAMVAGAVELRWPVRRPSWLPGELTGHYSGLDLGPVERDMRWPEIPFGVNMGLRRSLVESLGRFRDDLGRYGTNLLSNEDKEFAYRVYQAGGRVRYVPSAAVDHIVPPERTRFMWLVRRSYWNGVSDVRLAKYRTGTDVKSHVARGRGWMARNAVGTIAALRRGRAGVVLAFTRGAYVLGAVRATLAST